MPVAALSGATTSTTQSAPIDAIPIDAIPIDAIPIDAIPIDAITLDRLGITAQNLAQNALGGLPLTAVPLKPPLGWDQKLAGTVLQNVPIQTLTLANVLRLVAGRIDRVHFSDVNLSASPLGGLSLAAAALGSLPLAPIPIKGPSLTAPTSPTGAASSGRFRASRATTTSPRDPNRYGAEPARRAD